MILKKKPVVNAQLQKKFGLSVLFTWHGLLPIVVTLLVLENLPLPSILGVEIAFTVFVSIKMLKLKHEFAEANARREDRSKKQPAR